MSISCDPASLVKAAKCFGCIPPSMVKPVELYLLALANGFATDKNGVSAIERSAKCFDCVPKSMREPLTDYLYCQLANKGGGSVSPIVPSGQTYTTNFSTPQNPLSESGRWINGKTDGIDWSDCEAVFNAGVHYAAGLQDGPSQPNFSDATALLTGVWQPNQSVQCVFHSPGGISGFKEAEIRLRSTLTPNVNKGYEIDYSVSASTPYIAVIRWNGALGDFTDITPPPQDLTDFLHDGDVVFASIIGNNIIVKLNGATIYNFTDNSYATGNPGMGFSVPNNATVDTTFGFSSFTAIDGL